MAPDVAVAPDSRVARPGAASGVSRPESGSIGDDRRTYPDAQERATTITLTRSQIDHVVRGALADQALPGVPSAVVGSGLRDAQVKKALGERYRGLQGNRRLSRSLLAGLLVLSCFSPEGTELGIKDISDQLDLNSSTVHRYVATLLAAGLLERDPDTRRYRLLPE